MPILTGILGSLSLLANVFQSKVKSGANKTGIDKINLLFALLFLLAGIFCQIVVRQIKYLNNKKGLYGNT